MVPNLLLRLPFQPRRPCDLNSWNRVYSNERLLKVWVAQVFGARSLSTIAAEPSARQPAPRSLASSVCKERRPQPSAKPREVLRQLFLLHVPLHAALLLLLSIKQLPQVTLLQAPNGKVPEVWDRLDETSQRTGHSAHCLAQPYLTSPPQDELLKQTTQDCCPLP